MKNGTCASCGHSAKFIDGAYTEYFPTEHLVICFHQEATQVKYIHESCRYFIEKPITSPLKMIEELGLTL